MKLYKCNEYNKIRLGGKYDGGYVILDGLEYDFIIGCGVKNDVSFENMFVDKYKCDSLLFDGTIDKAPSKSKNLDGTCLFFNHKWINQNVFCGTLDPYLCDKKNIFLKRDIEGAEWDVFKNINLENVSQMVVEFHSGFKYPKIDMDILNKIEETHYMVHIHGNNYRKAQIKVGEQVIHSVWEATYINKKYCKNVSQIEYEYNEELDAPNNPRWKEVKNMII